MNVKIGEKYRVRSWESMKKEFGSVYTDLPDEYINCCASFVKSMRKYCGTIVTIDYVCDRNSDLFYIKEDMGKFTWSTDMIIPTGDLYEAIQNRRRSSDSSMG